MEEWGMRLFIYIRSIPRNKTGFSSAEDKERVYSESDWNECPHMSGVPWHNAFFVVLHKLKTTL